MKKSAKASTKLRRTTIYLPDVMAANLACLALETGETQATIIRQGLAEYMQRLGYKPYQRPKIKVMH